MPYDLYGNYYGSEREAMNAEMAQCAAIDASIANRDLERMRQEQEVELYYSEQWKAQIEQRLAALEVAIAKAEERDDR